MDMNISNIRQKAVRGISGIMILENGMNGLNNQFVLLIPICSSLARRIFRKKGSTFPV
jgi:hypothetical protein